MLRRREEEDTEDPLQIAPSDAHEHHILEGHSLGEILKGGFLLAMTEAETPTRVSPGRSASERLLQAAQLLLALYCTIMTTRAWRSVKRQSVRIQLRKEGIRDDA